MSPKEVYASFLEMQRNRELLDVITGKRQYSNMLLRTIEVTTDKTTENVLSSVLTLREVNITTTQTIQVADKTDMSQGADTSATQNAGVKSPVPQNESILSTLAGSAGLK